jgi:hypothetical protein
MLAMSMEYSILVGVIGAGAKPHFVKSLCKTPSDKKHKILRNVLKAFFFVEG